MEEPTVLILGGCGFIGRNLVEYLIVNSLVKRIRVVDKVPPQVAWLNLKHQEVFNNPIVEFKSANLINMESCENAFKLTEKILYWTYVINCAAETKSGQTDPVYKEGILKLSLNCAKLAALYKTHRYVELSSGQMYSSEKISLKEDDVVEPWTYVARWKKQVETSLAQIPDLTYTILRPAVVYGIGDKTGITPRIIAAAIYKKLGETMKLLWDKDLRLNTVHVSDVCRAIWFLCSRSDSHNQIYNIVDDANSTQGSISDILSSLFSIKVDYYGNLVSAVVDLAGAADEGNDKHLQPWAEACRKDGVQNTPLSPHMDVEILYHKHLRLDGQKMRDIGFNLSVARPTREIFNTIIEDYISMNIFPCSLAP